MATIERGIGLVQRIIAELSKRPEGAGVVGASAAALDALESKLMVELPPSLRTFLAYDFTFASFGKRFKGRHRFGEDARAPQPKITSVRKLAESMVELGWTDSRVRGKVVRLPNKPGHPWNAIYLGEARRDGELVILGLDHDETNVRVFPRYTAFDLYLAHQLGMLKLRQSMMLDDLESHLAHNPELLSRDEDEDESTDY
ncbi:MAG TPA: SMI1/KNR4 family protein [Polyangium sp.]|nr:SMI1/KNR4 family protein [Polyangium sp.]